MIPETSIQQVLNDDHQGYQSVVDHQNPPVTLPLFPDTSQAYQRNSMTVPISAFRLKIL